MHIAHISILQPTDTAQQEEEEEHAESNLRKVIKEKGVA